MKILIICSYRSYAVHTDYAAPFIYEQVQSLKQIDCKIDYFFVRGGGIKAYIKAILQLRKLIKNKPPHIIHAHGGLCGFVANCQIKVPVITTYHGSDINNPKFRFFSKIAIKKSFYNIFVSSKLVDIIHPAKKNYAVIPCGVDTDTFFPMDKLDCRKKLGWGENKIYILFSKAFFVKVKNYPLAKAAVDKIPNATLIELDGYNREEINLLMNACDVALMTSFTEGSPQFIKEAMACNCPIVSTDVGDVAKVIENIKNCFICPFDPDYIASKILICLQSKERLPEARERIENEYSIKKVAHKIKYIYEKASDANQ